jgi:uncharacterized membrane protein YcaP (DUF421 family)
MESVMRAIVVYLFLLVLFRIMGKRSLGQITTFDFVLLLIISEAIQNGMVGDDHSITNALVLVLVLTTFDLGLTLMKERWPTFARIAEGTPLIILENGQPLQGRMRKARVDEGDILTAARALRGLERLDQIKYAVLERSGQISVIPEDGRRGESDQPGATVTPSRGGAARP